MNDSSWIKDVFPIALLDFHLARTMLQTNKGHLYEVVTNDMSIMRSRGWGNYPRYASAAEFNYETAIYRAKPISEAVSHELQSMEYLQYPGTDYMRDLTTNDLFVRRTKTEDEAALVHEETVQEMKAGTMVLVPYRERLLFYGSREM